LIGEIGQTYIKVSRVNKTDYVERFRDKWRFTWL